MEAHLPPRRFLTCAAALVALVALTSGCGGGSDAPAAKDPPTAAPPVTYANSFLSFSHPAVWKAYPFRWPGELHFQPMVYVSTQPVHDPCRTKDNTTTCTWPVQRLEPNGVLLTWENRGFPGFSLASQPGSAISVGGRSAKRLATRPGSCAAIGGDLTIEVAIAQPTADNWTEATACLRGPNLTQNERSVDALLASTKFVSP
jgi:hypothetical protein